MILLIGYGTWGKQWAQVLFQQGTLAAVCDIKPQGRAEIAQQYPGVGFYPDLNSALHHPGLEAAVLASSIPTHTALAEKCLQANLPLLLEKPMTATLAEAQHLVELANTQNILLAAGFICLYQPLLHRLKALMQAGDLGDILAIESIRVKPGSPRPIENVWWDLATHDLSMLMFLSEQSWHPVSTYQMSVQKHPPLPDTAYASLVSESDIQASIHVSWVSPLRRLSLTVTGSQQTAVFDYTDPNRQTLSLLLPAKASRQLLAETTVNPLALMAESFLKSVRYGTPLENNSVHGLQVMQLLDAVQQNLLPLSPEIVMS